MIIDMIRVLRESEYPIAITIYIPATESEMVGSTIVLGKRKDGELILQTPGKEVSLKRWYTYGNTLRISDPELIDIENLALIMRKPILATINPALLETYRTKITIMLPEYEVTIYQTYIEVKIHGSG